MRTSSLWADARYFALARLAQATMVGVVTLALSGCVSLTAVSDFAQESSVISANKAALDDTVAQTQAYRFFQSHPAYQQEIPEWRSLADPASADFKARQQVTSAALDVLNSYMTLLAKLSAKDEASVSSGIAGIEAGLKQLNVADPKVKAGLDATAALANIILDAKVRGDVKRLVTASDPQIEQITRYLASSGEVAAIAYDLNIRINSAFWLDATRHCVGENCGPIVELEARAWHADNAELSTKAKAAKAAANAFNKIGADHAALARHASDLNAKALQEQLKLDEPLLLSAIQNLRSL